jgi:hypothetical protein
MNRAISIRSFIGSSDFSRSRRFYSTIGFTEVPLGEKMSYFEYQKHIGFYLQDYHVKAWIDNSMLFLELEDAAAYRDHLLSLEIHKDFPEVKITDIKYLDWGHEFFMHAPDNILWHIGGFNR